METHSITCEVSESIPSLWCANESAMCKLLTLFSAAWACTCNGLSAYPCVGSHISWGHQRRRSLHVVSILDSEPSLQENLFIGNDGRPLLANFDYASRSGSTSSSPWAIGSLRWMAPECIDSHEFTAERDIWAFGMTVLVRLFLHLLLFLIMDRSIGIVYCTASLC